MKHYFRDELDRVEQQINPRPCPEKSHSHYNRGCNSPDCREAANAYSRERRRKKAWEAKVAASLGSINYG